MADVGRPTKYDVKYNEQVYKLCLLGATDIELADFFEVSEATINNWKLEYPQFLESIKAGKEIANYTIAESLYERAKGCVITKQQAIKVKVDKDSERVEIVDLTETLPPDTTAMIFWLKNRKSAQWRDKQEIDHTTKGEAITGIDYSKLSDAAIREIIAAGRSSEGS